MRSTKLKPEILSAIGFLFEFVKLLVEMVKRYGGGDEHFRRLLRPEGRDTMDEIATLISGLYGFPYDLGYENWSSDRPSNEEVEQRLLRELRDDSVKLVQWEVTSKSRQPATWCSDEKLYLGVRAWYLRAAASEMPKGYEGPVITDVHGKFYPSAR